MKRPSTGLLVSASAHAALAAALIAGVSWQLPRAPQAPLSVDLVAIAAPTPIPAASVRTPQTPPPPPAATPAAAPAILPAPAELPLPPPLAPAPPQPAPKASPPPRQLALAAPPRPAAPANAAPAPAAQAANGAASSAPPADWLRAIAAWLASHRSYPAGARRAGEEGNVVLRLTVARDGAVLGVSVVQSSGYPDLDEASLAALRGAHLPAAPTADAPAEITLRVPIRYALEASN